jgi:biotin carboxyl carrier protein
LRYIATIGEREFLVDILDDQHVQVDGQTFEVDFSSIDEQPVISLLIDSRSIEAYVFPEGKGWQVIFQGNAFSALIEEEMEKTLRIASGSQVSEAIEYQLRSPMPGLVIAIEVSQGQEVQKGDVLIILESMKMQNELKAPRAGQVTRLRVKPGDGVEQHQVMLTLV